MSSAAPDPAADPPTPPTLPDPPTGEICLNCTAPLHGAYCHRCGQPLRNPVRELWTLTRDVWNEAFAMDGKFFNSLIPLLLRPGVLTRAYLGGRRFSFIRPVRLYLGVSIALFLVISIRGDGEEVIQLDPPAETVRADAGQLPPGVLATGKTDTVDPAGPEVAETKPAHVEALAKAAEATATAKAAEAQAAESKAVQKGDDKSSKKPKRPPPKGAIGLVEREDGAGLQFKIGGKTWDPRAQPLDLGWAPQWLDHFLTRQLIIIIENGHKIESDPKRLLHSMLDYLPQSMFFLLPVFALLLKLLYIFKRRLYAEHLIVALHSHSFMFLTLLLILLIESLVIWLPPLETPLFWLQIGLLVWMPIYLLIMQKRVYRQGWIMTLLKYSVTGFLYIMLIALTVSLAFLLALRFMD